MTEIIFAKTRYKYDSYIDFWRLVELSGFPICFVDEVDVSRDVIYINSPLNGEWRPHIDNQSDKKRAARLIHWNLERPSGSGGIGNYARSCQQTIRSRYFDEVWLSDKRLAQETGMSFIVLGSDYGLGEPGDPANMIYDFVHMSYIAVRREIVYMQFPPERIAPNCWPPQRDVVMKQSKFALNIHQDGYPFQEPLRFALFAAYGIPILSETISDAYPWNDNYMNFNPYHGIVGRLRQMLGNDYGYWRTLGLAARDYMCMDHRFGKMVREKLGVG